MRQRMTRRVFLRQAEGAAGLVILSGGPAARTYAANSKLGVALIGVGGRGRWFVDEIPKLETVVAMCDVNESKAAGHHRPWHVTRMEVLPGRPVRAAAGSARCRGSGGWSRPAAPCRGRRSSEATLHRQHYRARQPGCAGVPTRH